MLSWNCWWNIDKIFQHFGFVADFLKIVCQLMTFDNVSCLSLVSTLCCLHQHMTIRYCIFYFYYFIAIFAKQSADVLGIWISTEKISRCRILNNYEFHCAKNKRQLFLTPKICNANALKMHHNASFHISSLFPS